MSSNKKQRSSEVMSEEKSFIPRSYQVEILEAAKEQNTIACLGTGTGKTFIAVLLIREYAREVRISFHEGGKRIFFLVPTVPLVTQQSNTIKDHTDLKVKGYFGDMNVDSWNKDQWTNEFVENEVLVMTAEIFRIIVDHSFIPLNRINLLIIDECHRAQGDHPYRQALKCFIDLQPSEMPRIFGLSASLLNGKCKPTKLEKNLRDLEKTLRSTIVTATDVEDIQRYGTDPVEYVVFYNQYQVTKKCLVQEICSLMSEMKSEKSKQVSNSFYDGDVVFFDKPLRCLNSLMETFCNLGPWCAHKAAEMFDKEVSSLLLKSKGGPVTEEHSQILFKVKTFLMHFMEECKQLDVGNVMDKNYPNKLKRLIDIFVAVKSSNRFSSEPMKSLANIEFDKDPVEYYKMMKQRRGNSDINFCSIIFVKQRITAYVLCEWLMEMKKNNSALDFLKPDFVVGHGSPGSANETGMPQKRQQKVLKDFKDKNTNVLIATCVLEEGMDIQQCNIVVRFDLPQDFRAYVQSKGRARARNSIYIMLVEYGLGNREKFVTDVCNFITIEKMLLAKCHNRTMPDEDEIRSSMEDYEIPPYRPYGLNGPRITLTSSISLINRYCTSLPCDMATKLVPKWKVKIVDPDTVKKQYQCTLQMPINSPLRKVIIGEIMPQKKLAKMAAALKACKMLDEIGELNESLVPVSRQVDKALLEEMGTELEEEDGQGAIPGTNRRRQIYEKRVPIFLKDSRPVPGNPCFLHIIEMRLVDPLPPSLNPRGRPIIDPADTTRGLGILTSKKIPPVNSFPIFTKSGKVLVTVTLCKKEFVFSSEDLRKIEEFHQFIFTDALWITKNKLFSPSTAEMQLYIVPINRRLLHADVEIDWDFLNSTLEHPFNILKHKTSLTVGRTDFEEESFKNAVLMRSYTMDRWDSETPTFHHVIAILHDKSPLTEFENSEYTTFKGYYNCKYGIQILNDDQPLVETVQHGGLHFWKPLYVSAKETYDDLLSPLSKSKKKRKLYKEYLVPELCIVHPFPSPFFYKVRYLPTVLFRLRCLLLAEELRQRVAVEGLVGTVGEFTWPHFHLETSDNDLKKHLIEKGELMPETSELDFVPKDVIKNDDKITSFEPEIRLTGHPGPSPALLLQALTSTSADDEFDLERLEMIGDSFLKYAMSVKTYMKYPLFDEGKLTRLRSGLIQNLHLYQRAKKKGIGEYLTCKCFSCNSTWLPPCYTVRECVDPKALNKNKKDDHLAQSSYFTKQIISDKCVADSVEALIGAYLLSCGQRGALMFMSWLGLKPLPREGHPEPSDFENWPPPCPDPILSDMPMTNVERCLSNLTSGFDRFESGIKYKFKNRAFLLQAFTHPSYSYNEITDCYQRLEFLGDAVLDYLITRQLYEDPSGHSPGKLTDLRSALVNNAFFASLAVKYRYHDHLKMLSPELFRLLQSYVGLLRNSEAFKYFEEYGYYLEEIECFELEEVEVPKALGDVFESVAGAIYLDSGMSLDAVWNVCYPMIEPAMKHLCQYVPKSPVRELHEWVKTDKVFGEAVQREDKTFIEAVLPDGRRFAGVGPNKKVAKRSAAKRALVELKKAKMDVC